ncbi:MAG: C4-dicarboxylic acid transporter DauA [Gammaproteobacteria bacterium]|nr:C4-dicarboxylic acid transporter DauA [Gammaproteobacteria bacterium]
MFDAIRHTIKNDLTFPAIRSNLSAGLTVGIIALPLSMALAIASGVPPQHGLYTAIIAGIVIAATGGSSVNISGPTAAFVVVLLPIVQQFGLGGLLISGFMAGVILVLLGVARLGRLIEVVPYPVVIGFTAGIAVVIATLQIKDLLGLEIDSLDGHFVDKIAQIVQALPTLKPEEVVVGTITLAVLLVWPRLRLRIPRHLVAILIGSLVAWWLNAGGESPVVATISTRFHYLLDGISGNGIPPILPEFAWLSALPDANGQPIGLSFELVRQLLPAALTIAVLGAIESLLCAVVADGMSGRRHNPNDELVAQGIGNMLGPFFGGIPATAAIARTAANVRAGGTSPIAAITHGIFILLAIVLLAPLLGYIPMSAMAALLLVVAWNMSEARHFVRTARIAPRDDKLVLLTCFSLTVLFDMTIAVGVGMALAGMLFFRRTGDLTQTRPIRPAHDNLENIPDSIAIYDINGPLFFGSAHKALRSLIEVTPQVRVVILDMSEVSLLDMSALVAMESIVENLGKRGVGLVINNLQPRMLLKLRRAGIRRRQGRILFSRDLREAIEKGRELAGKA